MLFHSNNVEWCREIVMRHQTKQEKATSSAFDLCGGRICCSGLKSSMFWRDVDETSRPVTEACHYCQYWYYFLTKEVPIHLLEFDSFQTASLARDGMSDIPSHSIVWESGLKPPTFRLRGAASLITEPPPISLLNQTRNVSVIKNLLFLSFICTHVHFYTDTLFIWSCSTEELHQATISYTFQCNVDNELSLS